MIRGFSEQLAGHCEFYTEANKETGVTDFMFEGIVAQADRVNGNGRVYPSKVLMPAVEQYIEKRVNKNLAMGELDHPESLIVSMKNVSHLITDLSIEGSDVVGKGKLAHTPVGEIARGLAETGVQLTTSTRGAGRAVKRRNFDEMRVFILTAIDLVSYPSAPDAFVNKVAENKEYFVENGYISKEFAMELAKHTSFSSAEFKRALSKISKEMLK